MRERLPKKRLGDLGEWVGGGTPDRAKARYWENGSIFWASPSDMRDSRIIDTEEKITAEALAGSTARLLPAESAVIVVRSGILRKRLPVAFLLSDCAINQDLKALIPYNGTHPRYAYQVISCHAEQIRQCTQKVGTTVESLDVSSVKDFEVFVPGYPEQSAIADMLDAIDAAIEETEALITKLKLVRIGLVDDLLTRGIGGNGDIRGSSELAETLIGKRPSDWSVGSVGALLKTAEYGVSISLGDGPGVPVLRMNNIQDGEFDLADMKFASANAVSHLRLAPGDVLYNRTNSIEHVGKGAIWRSNEAGPAFASYLVRLVPHGHLASGFLHIWLNWAPVQRALRRFATPGVQQVNVNPTNLKRVIMAAPNDPEEQREIVRRVDQVRLRIEAEKHKLVKLSAVRNGLRDDLLSGRVRVSTAKTEAVA